MNYNLIANKYKVSCVGIGGHYSKMEEGFFEYRYADVETWEISKRSKLIQNAFEAGINYFDTTWRNEVEMLSKSIKLLNIRDKIFINGMVLGVFTGSDAAGIDVCDYLNKWLDERLRAVPGNRLDSFMINAIEENFSEDKCEKLIRLMEKRKHSGDFDVIGFSSHNQEFARKIADNYDEFELIMIPYNFANRRLESAFNDYRGNASLIAMKPLIWSEYGIPFCSLNNLPDPGEILDIKPVSAIVIDAIKWILTNRKISCTVCAVNSENELNELIQAGCSEFSMESENMLISYQNAIIAQKSIPFFISTIFGAKNNRRLRYFGLINLAKALGVILPDIALNNKNSDKLLNELQESLIVDAKEKGTADISFNLWFLRVYIISKISYFR